jgi:hypothetical protein
MTSISALLTPALAGWEAGVGVGALSSLAVGSTFTSAAGAGLCDDISINCTKMQTCGGLTIVVQAWVGKGSLEAVSRDFLQKNAPLLHRRIWIT